MDIAVHVQLLGKLDFQGISNPKGQKIEKSGFKSCPGEQLKIR